MVRNGSNGSNPRRSNLSTLILTFFEEGAGASAVFPVVLALFGESVLAFFDDGVAVGISDTIGKLGDCVTRFFREVESTFEICSL